MKRSILLLTFLLWAVTTIAQRYSIDTVIRNSAYVSYFNKTLKVPLFVSYRLWRGGGNCDRKSLKFYNDTKILMASSSDYVKSGFDKGHLVPAEDMSFDCQKLELTFRFYNCLPQLSSLNRGSWKSLENSIRKESQRDSLLILAGGIFEKPMKIGKGIAVPNHCWKVVQDLRTKTTRAWIFENSQRPQPKKINVEDLEKRLGFRLPLKH